MSRDYRKNGRKNAAPDIPAENLLAGKNAVAEALAAGRGINTLYLVDGMHGSAAGKLIELAKTKGVPYRTISREKLDSLAQGIRHQGVLAIAAPVRYVEVDEILSRAEEKGDVPFLMLLDELEDPHNLGALLRTADAVGIHGILIPKRRSVPLNATVAKTSAGAIEHVPVARIGNVAQTVRRLKEKGLWVIGADMTGEVAWKADLTGPTLLIVGNEGYGMSRLTRELCDIVVKLPMHGKINSLNASVAGGVLAYEILRQRSLK